MSDGGYDEGYTVCPCFWGKKPAEFVVEGLRLLGTGDGRRALDFGCGEGKNAVAMAQAGFQVTAIDKSDAAIENATRVFTDCGVGWLVGDLLCITGPRSSFDLVIATGSLHCLKSAGEITQAIASMQSMTRKSGLNVMYSFNDGPQNFAGHRAEFRPLLLSHDWYMQRYRDWEILQSSNITQRDEHPHNGFQHFHSITRILARRLT